MILERKLLAFFCPPLAQAILEFYPNAKLTIGPAIEKGFYYDVDFGDESLSDKDFEKIEKKF
jgi:threonyl-tRNA synthetase